MRLHPLAAMVLSIAILGYGFESLGEATWRLLLWVTDKFQPYMNHADTDVARVILDCAACTAGIALLTLITKRGKGQRLMLILTGVIALLTLSFKVMVMTKGLVTYDEYISHGA